MGRLFIVTLAILLLLPGCKAQRVESTSTPAPTESVTPSAEPTATIEAITSPEVLTRAFSKNLYRSATPSKPRGQLSKSLVRLAHKIVKGKNNDRDKAIAIYDWLTENIEYDVLALDNGDLAYKTPDSIILRRKAVCSGYAELFHLFCKEVGLESEIILGRSRADDQGLPPVLRNSPVNHAWNAV